MIKMKKTAFTLSEALITLTVVGILGALVIPGLIKDFINRANIALLQSTVSQLSDAIQVELVQSKVTNVKDALFVTGASGPSIREFVRRSFDVIEECESKYGTSCTAGKGPDSGATGAGTTGYKSMNGKDAALFIYEPSLLANGVAIDFHPNYSVTGEDVAVRIDLNGKKSPNIIGVDTFYLYIIGTTDLDKGRQVGDVKGLIQPHSSVKNDSTDAELLADCKTGRPSSCYLLLERTGFDPNYMQKE